MEILKYASVSNLVFVQINLQYYSMYEIFNFRYKVI